MPSKGAQIVQQ